MKKLLQLLVLAGALALLINVQLAFRGEGAWLLHTTSTSLLPSLEHRDTTISPQTQNHTLHITTVHRDGVMQTRVTNATIPATRLVLSNSTQTGLGNQCEVPPGGFRAWQRGLVTVLEPELGVDCSRTSNITSRNLGTTQWKNTISNREMLKRVKNCTWLRDYFSNNLYMSELERSFPLAFSFVVHESPQQVLRLMRVLYRPHNSYCIHYDAKSEDSFKTFFQSVAGCLGNVVVASKLERVVWGHYSVLAAQMNCLKDLLRLRATQTHKWQYLINLCGKELPLHTNREIVSRLRKLNGSSSVMPYKCNITSFEYISRIRYPSMLNRRETQLVVDHNHHLENPPFDPKTQFYKSKAYVALSHAFARFLATNSTALKVYKFFKKCQNPEEHFYATMYMMPGVPGGYDRRLRDSYVHVESVYWWFLKHRCSGRVVRDVCVVGIGDLEWVLEKEGDHLFHNKYSMEFDHTVMNCVEQRLVHRNRREYQQECLEHS